VVGPGAEREREARAHGERVVARRRLGQQVRGAAFRRTDLRSNPWPVTYAEN
jgi:hypothetical protein